MIGGGFCVVVGCCDGGCVVEFEGVLDYCVDCFFVVVCCCCGGWGVYILGRGLCGLC